MLYHYPPEVDFAADTVTRVPKLAQVLKVLRRIETAGAVAIAWKIAISLPIMHRTLVLLAAGTGMRMSELLGLRWGDTDFAKKKITLNQTWVYGRIESGKTDESRGPWCWENEPPSSCRSGIVRLHTRSGLIGCLPLTSCVASAR
jgi:integrase